MKKGLVFIFFLFSIILHSQTNFADSWEGFYSYTNVKKIHAVGDQLFAITDNAAFIYNSTTRTTKKLSSVQGFSGETTSSLYYSEAKNKLIIGYDNGLIEILDESGKITTSASIVNFHLSGDKSINHISEYNGKIYLSTPFAIVVYDLNTNEFGDTYFIGQGASSLHIYKTIIANNQIYAATKDGIYRASLSEVNLIDFTKWTKVVVGNTSEIAFFDSKIYYSIDKSVFLLDKNTSSLQKTFLEEIVSLFSSTNYLLIAHGRTVELLNDNLASIKKTTPTKTFNYQLNSAIIHGNNLLLATMQFGILSSEINAIDSFTEIHPTGPLTNNVFSIATYNNSLWLVYGGYNSAYAPLAIRQGISRYNGETWMNLNFDTNFPVLDMVSITIDESHENKAYISSYSETENVNTAETGGLLEVENNQIKNFYNHKNSDLENLAPNDNTYASVRISGSVFDPQGNLWVTNAWVANKLKKKSTDGSWASFDLSSLQTNNALGLNEITIDNTNSLWIGTRRNGAYVYNESGNNKIALTTSPTRGNLPHANVRTIAVDSNNNVWIGTQAGLVVFSDASSVFDGGIFQAEPVIILDDGIPKKLLGNQIINTIAIDGANNKWFGTDGGGVLYTNSTGQKTLEKFTKSNSPLPSNKILKISVDKQTGKVFIATDKGVVAYKSKVASYGSELKEVYAYPNPALKNHQTITIDGRNGNHLPKGANIKIVDAAGNLVFETNIVEGQENFGGKVVWDKTNLSGKKVSSGVYIVLITNRDGTESSTTKLAIVN